MLMTLCVKHSILSLGDTAVHDKLIINNKNIFLIRAYAAPNPALTFFFFVAMQRKRTQAKKKKPAD